MRSWSEAFAEQAAADLSAYEELANTTLPQSHRLHYLQMWLEKLCKAYIHHANLSGLVMDHNVVAKVLPRLVGEHWRRIGFDHPLDKHGISAICREIDLLHPQVKDDNRRLDNVEYPWPGTSGDIEVPALWKFRLTERLYTNLGKALLKAARYLTQNPAIFIQ